MTSQGTAHGRFQRAINRRQLLAAEIAAREMGGLSLADALSLCELLAKVDPARYERAALRWLERFIEERLPPLTEVALGEPIYDYVFLDGAHTWPHDALAFLLVER